MRLSVQRVERATGTGREVGGLSADAAARPRVVVLFHGSAGTGRTLAAHVLAEAISLRILRVDLRHVVSKYIGETEKNLAAQFDRAEHSGAILFFDEADALFGKRSEVKNAHDRYANAGFDHLLQRIETYDGIVALASNVLPQMEGTFADNRWRRLLRQSIRFPRPRH